ncbi:hypothetical protein C450_09503 [Halococcus salifodinae DSM 8989]|uniref:GH26 domain-containing protein n=1 Tax=Halococcus salifodinae DSM 8989 TaxID=1227456 RepID=M0N5B3_9EURY|nr:hypothetical protein C450_09503 [Halococcus salifodinae DSM 8989]
MLGRLALLGGTAPFLEFASRPAAAQSAAVGELGTTSRRQSTSGEWHRLSFEETYEDPVVVMGPLSRNGGESGHVRLQNVTGDGVDWRIEEWEHLDEIHTEETVSYLVVESGAHEADGTTIRAGTVDADDHPRSVSFSSSFEQPPVVLATSQTFEGDDPVVTRLRDVSAGGFDVEVQEAEANGSHTDETIGYIAVGGSGDRFETGTVIASNGWVSPSLSTEYPDPGFVASVQSMNGHDTVGLRRRSLDASSVDLYLEEERSQDTETSHTDEIIGYVFGENGPIKGTNGGDTRNDDIPQFGAWLSQNVGEDPTEDYEDWLGRKVLVSDQFIKQEGHYHDLPAWKIDPWTAWLEENPDRRLCWDLIIRNLASLEAGASGAANDAIRSLGETLVAEGHEDAYVRIEDEFNLSHTIHPQTNQECQWFVEFWREVVDTLRSVDGQQFDIVWNPNYDIADVDGYAERTWPGDGYVDTVGLDIYDRSWTHYNESSEPTQTDWEQTWQVLEDYLDWFRDWADDHDKALAIPEWGLWSRADSGYGGGDNPYFIEQMHDWIHANDVAWHVYFEDLDKHRLDSDDTRFPAAAAKFKQLFG